MSGRRPRQSADKKHLSPATGPRRTGIQEYRGCPVDPEPSKWAETLGSFCETMVHLVHGVSKGIFKGLVEPTLGEFKAVVREIPIRLDVKDWVRLRIGNTAEEQAKAEVIRAKADLIKTINSLTADGGEIRFDDENMVLDLKKLGFPTDNLIGRPVARALLEGPDAGQPLRPRKLPLKDLPVAPRNAVGIINLARNKKAGTADAVPFLEADPALAGGLLRYVNSAYIAPANKITDLKLAAARCGYKTLVTLALGLSLRGSWVPCCDEFDYERFWKWSAASGAAARLWADKADLCDPEEAFTLGLLGQVGRLAMATAWPREYGTIIFRGHADSGPRLAREETLLFGMDHNQVSAAMFADWGLQDSFQAAVLHQYDENPSGIGGLAGILAEILSCSSALARVFTSPRGATTLKDLTKAEERSSQILGNKIPFGDIFNGAIEDWHRVGRIFEMDTDPVEAWPNILASAI